MLGSGFKPGKSFVRMPRIAGRDGWRRLPVSHQAARLAQGMAGARTQKGRVERGLV